jgi:hypothetical protein
VKIEWVGASVTSMPMKVPPVFAGGRLLVYGFPKTKERPTAIRLSAKGPSNPLSFEVPLAGARVAQGKSVATLAARARIRELEEGGEWLTARGSRQQERKVNSVSKEIIDLSVRYSLVSRETSFVAVERRETPVTGDVHLRRVPIALTDGWGGVVDRRRGRADFVSGLRLGAPKAARSTLDTGVFSLADFGEASARGHERAVEIPRPGWARRLFAGRRHIEAPPAGLHALVALQRADGFWELTRDLAAILGRELSELEYSIDSATGDRADIRRAWGTALAITWLHLHAANVEDQWQLLGRKAQRWLDDVSAVAPGGVSWMDAARRFLS